MFSLESSQLDVSPAFIAFSIIQKPFDRHADGAVSGHAKSTRPGLLGGVDISFKGFNSTENTRPHMCGQLGYF